MDLKLQEAIEIYREHNKGEAVWVTKMTMLIQVLIWLAVAFVPFVQVGHGVLYSALCIGFMFLAWANYGVLVYRINKGWFLNSLGDGLAFIDKIEELAKKGKFEKKVKKL